MWPELEAAVLAVMMLGRIMRQLWDILESTRAVEYHGITWGERRSWDEVEENIGLCADHCRGYHQLFGALLSNPHLDVDVDETTRPSFFLPPVVFDVHSFTLPRALGLFSL